VTLVKDAKADFIQDHHKRHRAHYDGILQCGREIGLNSKYSLCKWEFLAKEQGRGQWMENYQEETSGVMGILAKPI